jgi:hypothetical protein
MTTEILLTEEFLGIYAQRWLTWAEKNYPQATARLRQSRKVLTTAREVEKSAQNYKEVLEKEYQIHNPRPLKFEEILKWEEQKDLEIDSKIMRERVLIPLN